MRPYFVYRLLQRGMLIRSFKFSYQLAFANNLIESNESKGFRLLVVDRINRFLLGNNETRDKTRDCRSENRQAKNEQEDPNRELEDRQDESQGLVDGI